MDFAAFSDEGFEATHWVNQALAARPQSSSEDAHASMLVTKLQTFIQKVNSELQETSRQVVQDLPSVVRSIDVIAQELSSLKERMALVKQDIERVEQDTAQSMALLVELDRVKERIEETSSALQEADNWTTLSTDIEAAFVSEDLAMIASTLLGMQRSLMVLSDVPDYEDRQRRVVMFQNKFEALISPRLLDAFTHRNLEVAKECRVMFADMDRLPQLCNYYYRSQKAPVFKAWAAGAESERPLTTWLPEFHDKLVGVANAEHAWTRDLFPDAEEVLGSLMVQILSERKPPFAECLKQHHREHGLPGVIECFEMTQGFAGKLPKLGGAVLDAVFEPFVHYQIEFGHLAEQEMAAHVTGKINFDVTGLGLEQGAEVLQKALVEAFRLMGAATDSCRKLTGMAACEGLCAAISATVDVLCSRINHAVDTLRQECGLRESLSAVAGAGDNEDDEADAWEQVHGVFRLIQLCGELIRRLGEVEETLRSTLLHHKEALQGKAPPLLMCDYLHNRPRPRKVLAEFLESLTKGEPLLSEADSAVLALNTQVHKFGFDAVLAPIAGTLDSVSTDKVWTEAAAESEFSMAPLGYITKVGEQLLTLPQLLEPFISAEDNTVTLASQRCSLPFASQDLVDDTADSLADRWLGSVARGIMDVYAKQILKIPRVTSSACKQLCIDIDYLCNVLSALDVLPSGDLLHVTQLLSVDVAEVAETAQGLEDVRPELVARVEQMRKMS
eukprot:m.489477 g.489477  ORF g.489477 m.489477 type:complete len:730 (-) comp26803_c0_seq1:35-2224(-)